MIMANEFQQDYDIRDCAAIKVSAILENLHIGIVSSQTVDPWVPFVCGA